MASNVEADIEQWDRNWTFLALHNIGKEVKSLNETRYTKKDPSKHMVVFPLSYVIEKCYKYSTLVTLSKCYKMQTIVKIFILVTVSNAMNPQEDLVVPSLFRTTLPGQYIMSHLVSLCLPQSGHTWIISWPDYTGFYDLNLSSGPGCTFHQSMGICLQARIKDHFHLTF